MGFIITIFIILESMGAILYNNAADIVENTNNTVNTLMVDAFNSSFEIYTRTVQTKPQVIALINKVIANNKDEDTFSIVSVNNISDEESLLELISTYKSATGSLRYNVTGDYDENGLITNINIEQK